MTHRNTVPGAPAIHHDASRRLFMRQASALSVVAGAGAAGGGGAYWGSGAAWGCCASACCDHLLA